MSGTYPIDNLRLMSLSENEWALDIHYSLSATNAINSRFISGLSDPSQFVPQAPTAVQDAPSGETLVALADWLSPPMQLGAEYRTAERYNGKAVYAKAISFGQAPNATYKDVSHGIENFRQLVSYTGMMGGANLIEASAVDSIQINASIIRITTNTDVSASYVYLVLRYTKTTD